MPSNRQSSLHLCENQNLASGRLHPAQAISIKVFFATHERDGHDYVNVQVKRIDKWPIGDVLERTIIHQVLYKKMICAP